MALLKGKKKAAGEGQGPGNAPAGKESPEKAPVKTYDWKSPVSFDAKTMTTILRKILDDGGYRYVRESGEKSYGKFMIVMPMPKFAYVYRFRVEEPIELVIEMYDTKPTHSGVMPYLEIRDITDENSDNVKDILREIREQLPRPPWKFTWGQKLQYALLATEYIEAKRAWKSMGFNVK